MQSYMLKDFIKSWATKESTLNSINDILLWVKELNKKTKVNIKVTDLSKIDFWKYNRGKGTIANKNGSFFYITGVKKSNELNEVIQEQPIIVQDEIGYLGIICKKIDGVIHFLMQAKIEPGNINNIQISPTIQATKSNFMQKHGGRKPNYFEYFMNSEQYEIIVDQIQSEQSSRFFKKRNRNIIIMVNEKIEVLPNFKWMTLGQIKELMRIDNLVNMDTRTVLSCIPYGAHKPSFEELQEIKSLFNDKALYYSIFNSDETYKMVVPIFNDINNYKMFNESRVEIVPLEQLEQWNITDHEIYCKTPYEFSVIFCDIEVDGREVRKWSQPLIKANGIATFGLFTTVDNGIRKFLVKCMPEIGCFDQIEIGPTVQLEAVHDEKTLDFINILFREQYRKKEGVIIDVLLSEEGGRFYHEQNKNIILEVDKIQDDNLPKGYFWLDFKTLNILGQINNNLNIQLRNLLSLLGV